MSDLVAFLAARTDEDEQQATAEMAAVCPSCGSWGVMHACSGLYVSDMGALHPARVLREVAAKRAILGAYESQRGAQFSDRAVVDELRDVVETLAAVYSDHPGYDQERQVSRPDGEPGTGDPRGGRMTG